MKNEILILILIGVFLYGCGVSSGKRKASVQADFGITAADKGLWKEAIYRWKKALEIEPENAKYHNNLAVAYEANQEYKSAARQYRKALELAPDNEKIGNNYERFLEHHKDFGNSSSADHSD